MYTYSDTVLTFTIPGLNIQTATNPHVTFKQKFREALDVTELNVIDDHTFTIRLSQEQTARFKEGIVEVQFNFFNSAGNRQPSSKAKLEVKDNLLKQVISNE